MYCFCPPTWRQWRHMKMLCRRFPSCLSPLFQSESWCEAFHMEISFVHMKMNQNLPVNKINFHMKGFALGRLALRQLSVYSCATRRLVLHVIQNTRGSTKKSLLKPLNTMVKRKTYFSSPTCLQAVRKQWGEIKVFASHWFNMLMRSM